MYYKHNPKLTGNAKVLRKNMTKEERHLWYDFLKDYPVRVLRQKVIDRYIVDFYFSAARIAIELDGSQHYEEKGFPSAALTNPVLLHDPYIGSFQHHSLH